MLAFLGVLLAGALPLPAQDKEYIGDLVCGGKQRFTTPGECLKACSSQKRTLGNFSAGICGFSSSCTAYGKEVRSALPQFYNQALLGRGVVGGEVAKLVLASHIINTYYPPNTVKQIAVSIGATDQGEFAHVEPPAKPGEKAMLTIQDDLFYTAPGYLISTIGHEMVHLEQQRRIYKTKRTGINSLVVAMRELEASSWEVHGDNFSRTFGASQVGTCMRNQEKTAQQQILACRHWQVKKAIENILTGARKDAYSNSVAQWLAEDPWASQVWLPANPDWKTQSAGKQPEECGNT